MAAQTNSAQADSHPLDNEGSASSAQSQANTPSASPGAENIESNPAPAPDDSTVARPARSPAHRFHSPLLEGDTGEPPQNLGATPRLLSILDIASVVAVLAFVGVLAFWAVGAYRKHQSTTVSTRLAAAQDSFRKEKFADVTKALDEVKSVQNLKEAQLAMLDESHFQLGKQAVEQGRSKEAVSHLENVRPESHLHLAARDLLLRVVNPPAIVEEVTPEEPRPRTKPAATRRRTLSERPILSLPELPELNKDKAPSTASSGETSEEEIVVEESNSSEASPSRSRQVAMAAKARFSEKDLSTYNQMLAVFLSRGKQASEPPTFKDWLQNGRATF